MTSEERLLAMASQLLDAIVEDTHKGTADAIRKVIAEWTAGRMLPLTERRLLEVAYRIRDNMERRDTWSPHSRNA